MDLLSRRKLHLPKMFLNSKRAFRSKTFSARQGRELIATSADVISSDLRERRPTSSVLLEPSSSDSSDAIDGSSEDKLSSNCSGPCDTAFPSIRPPSPHIPTKLEITDANIYTAPCERALTTNKCIYLINDRLPSISTGMSKIEFGVQSSDFSPLAFKTVNDRKDAERELELLSLAKGIPHVIQLIDTFIDEAGRVVLVLPVLRRLKLTRIDLVDVAKYTKQLLEALKGLHERNIAHMDITPANLMADENGDLVLIDFGLSTVLKADAPAPSCGTPGYIAPEVFTGVAPLTTKVDIYSAGIVVGCMLEPYIVGCNLQFLGGNLLRASDTESIVSHIHSFISRSPSSKIFLQSNLSACSLNSSQDQDIPAIIYQAADFLANMLTTNPDLRFSAEELLQHSFLSYEDTPEVFNNIDIHSCDERKQMLEYRERQWQSMGDSDDDCYYSHLSYQYD